MQKNPRNPLKIGYGRSCGDPMRPNDCVSCCAPWRENGLSGYHESEAFARNARAPRRTAPNRLIRQSPRDRSDREAGATLGDGAKSPGPHRARAFDEGNIAASTHQSAHRGEPPGAYLPEAGVERDLLPPAVRHAEQGNDRSDDPRMTAQSRLRWVSAKRTSA